MYTAIWWRGKIFRTQKLIARGNLAEALHHLSEGLYAGAIAVVCVTGDDNARL